MTDGTRRRFGAASGVVGVPRDRPRPPRAVSRLAACVLALIALGALGAPPVPAEQPVPVLRARVTDLTGTLTQPQSTALEETLAAFERQKGAQVAVLIVPTTAPETIEQYSMRVVERWKLGRKGVDDGALLIVAKDDRALRIEVGYGLEGVLTDATTNRLIDEIIVPRFRTGDYAGGIEAGVERMLRVIDGEPLPEPQRQPRPGGGLDALAPVLPVIFIFAVTLGALMKRLFGQLAGALATGAIAGAIAWLIVGLVATALLAAFAAFALTLFSGVAPGRWASGRGRWGGGGFGGGWSGGGGGGFGGGGGGFGGGGSSGRW